ncbi:KR domain-containing protein [Streptomyces zhaozhouensis]|uniref:KR domain-containing protein n=1 Tax=Streptomyces zhaozhouensis TaxID=1300267 RepID=A0A286E0S5_9ACTN|nr:SDR family NAD(P)-dependent oxidoreductase [Streptomyces zhaozhouensis]SOD64504.1 KR domain-containing protein [Streptomyces zhaozhouensis]
MGEATVDAAASDEALLTPGAEAPILRHVLGLAPLPPVPAPAADALAGRRVLVLGGDARFRGSVRAAVAEHGGAPVDWDEAAGEPAEPGAVDAVVDGGLAPGTPVAAGSWSAAFGRTLAALRWLYADWARETDARRLCYLAVTWMGGSMGLTAAPDAQPLGGLWAGLAKTLPREFPAVDVRVVDLDPTLSPGGPAVAEMVGGRLWEVGHGPSGRLALLAHATESAGEPVELGTGDTLLMTGGARGIGFEFALHAAVRTGCRVLVSGRAELPVDRPVWLTASAEEFAAWERRAYAERDPAEPLPDVRRRLGRMRQLREIAANLERARLAGAEIVYQRCEVTDPAQVAALVERAGPGLAVVVHNAGLDLPTRLPGKTAAQVERVVGVKVDGFLHLVEALGDRPLRMLCAVGSLTGRYGGMTGQTDYAAANEGLARLALRAGHRLPYPVACLSWPTWDGVGLITNLDAAARYMTPIGVAEGVAAWLAEITGGGRGEICFMGGIGLVSPQHLRGIAVPSDWHGRTAMLSRRFFLGEVAHYAPTAHVVTEHRLDPTWATCLTEVEVDGAPALPLSLAVEYLRDGAGWLLPGGEPAVAVALCDLAVRPERLRLRGPALELTREARLDAEVRDGLRTASVRLTTRDGGVVAEARALLAPTTGPWPAQGALAAAPGPLVAAARWEGKAPPGGYAWPGRLWAVGEPTAADGGRRAEVRPVAAAEWFALVDPPHPVLPVAAVEAVAAFSPVVGAAGAAGVGPAVWRADRLSLAARGGEATEVWLADDGRAALRGPAGTVAEVRGQRWESA